MDYYGAMTEQAILGVKAFLVANGFVDEQAVHPWNDLQMSREFRGYLHLVVWRRYSLDALSIQIYGQDYACVTLGEVSDESALAPFVQKAIDFLSNLPPQA